MNVLVILEDHRRDQDLVLPIFKALFKEIGFPRAKLRVCQNPTLHSVTQALNGEIINRIVDQYRGQTDLFLLIVDRDAQPGRKGQLEKLEAQSSALLQSSQALFGEHAIEEVEVWVLAGLDLPAGWRWQALRSDPHPKERYFQTLLTEHRKLSDVMPSRQAIANESARSIRRILTLCDEDLGRLARRIRERCSS